MVESIFYVRYIMYYWVRGFDYNKLMCSCNVQNHKNFILAYFTDIVIIFHVDKPLKNVDIDLLECKGQEYVTIITISFLPTFYNLYAQQHIMQFV